MGGTKDMELEKYAVKFSNEGYAVLLYDYRYFEDSGGIPRHFDIYFGTHFNRATDDQIKFLSNIL